MATCRYCKTGFEDVAARPGPRRRYCGGACRQASHVRRHTGRRTIPRHLHSAAATALGL